MEATRLGARYRLNLRGCSPPNPPFAPSIVREKEDNSRTLLSVIMSLSHSRGRGYGFGQQLDIRPTAVEKIQWTGIRLMDSPLVDPRIRVHPKRCARIHASKDHGCDYMKGMGGGSEGKREKRVSDEKKGWEMKGEKGMIAGNGQTPGYAAGKVDPAEFALGKGWSVRTGVCADFMMFFDATARPGRDGAEMNSRARASYPLFRPRLWNGHRSACSPTTSWEGA